MRLPFIAFCALATATSLSQLSGSYDGKTWSINPARALIWGGKPYIPAGWRMPGTPEVMTMAAATGLKDAILDLQMSTDWKEVFSTAENLGLRYIVSVDSAAPGAPAFIVRPSSFRISSIPRSAEYKIPFPNARSVYYLLLSEPDFGLANKGWAEVSGGIATISVRETISSGSYLLLLYPRQTSSDLPDYWEGFDKNRDTFISKLKKTPPGAGLRGILNPTGRVSRWTVYGGGYVPDSPTFRLEFEAYLRTTYKDMAALERAWRVTSSSIRDFASAARLIALFDKWRGLDALFDPQNNVFVGVERKGCLYWKDVQTVIENAAARRTARLAKAIRQIVDVPVLYEWLGWSPIYDSRDPSGDGIGISAIGTGFEASEKTVANAASTLLSYNNIRWLVATSLQGTDEKQFRGVVTDTSDLGVKGWYARWSGGAEAPWLKAIAGEIAADSNIANQSPRAIFYPENARNPASTMRLPGGIWWLPTPAAGNRLEAGPDYEAYRLSAPFANFTALWRLGAPAKVKLRFADPSRARITRFDGQPVQTKLLKDGVELVIDNLPILIRGTDEIPVPQDSLDIARADFQELTAEAQSQNTDIADLRFGFEDAARSVDRNPGASYEKMTASLRDLQIRVAPFVWLEGEKSAENNFSRIEENNACSNGKALTLDTLLKPGSEGYFATYNFRTKPSQEDMDIWLAARIPEQVRQFVTVEIGGTRLSLANPQSGYGDKFAWYYLGKVNLRKGSYTMTVRVSQAASEYEVGIDAILITPLPFRTLGPRMPRYTRGS